MGSDKNSGGPVPTRNLLQYPARSRAVGTGKGPILVGSAAGGFVDQIEPGITGFLVDILSCQHVTQTLHQVLNLSPEAQATIRHRAHQRVVQTYDFIHNFPATLSWFWQRAPRIPGQHAR